MKKENQNGITLIALIITIIVMLILVSVSIATAVNSGLFEHAKKATEEWAKSQEQEANINGDIVDKYVSLHDWERTGDTLYCDHCKKTFEIGEYLEYEPDEVTTELQIGAEETGTRGTQTIGQQKNTQWKVIGIEDSDENGTNETLLIKMANPTNVKLTLVGAKGYNNGIDIMYRICNELYSSSRYGQARSITLDDINNTLQYSQNALYMDDFGSTQEVQGTKTLKDVVSEGQWKWILDTGTRTPDGTNTEEKLGKYKLSGYYYQIEGTTITNPVTGATTTITEKEAEAIGINQSYWFATRGVTISSTYVVFGTGSLEGGLVYSFNDLFYNNGEQYDYTFSVCPVVTLRNEIPDKVTQ